MGGRELKSHYKNTAEAAGSLVDDHLRQCARTETFLAVTQATQAAVERILESSQSAFAACRLLGL